MAGKGPGEQEELQPCRKRLWPVSMPLGGLTKSWGAGEQWPSSCGTDGGGPKTPFCCAAQLGNGAQPVPVEQVCYQSRRPQLGQCCPCSQLRSLGLPAAGQCFAAASTQKKPGEGHSSPIWHRYQIQSCRGQGSSREPSPSQAHTTAGHKGRGREHHAAAALLPSLNSGGNTGLYRLSMTAKKQLTGCRHHVPSPLRPCRCRRMAGSQGPVSTPHCAWLAGWALWDHHCLCANKWLWCHGPGMGPAHGALLREVFRKPLVPQLICRGCVGLAEAGA